MQVDSKYPMEAQWGNAKVYSSSVAMGVLQNPWDLQQICQKRGCCSLKNISKMLPDTTTISNKLVKCILLKTADQKEVLFSLFFSSFPLYFVSASLFPDGCPSGEMSFWARTKDWGIINFCYWDHKTFFSYNFPLFSIISCPLFPYVTLPQREPSSLYIFFSFHSMQNPVQSSPVLAWRFRNMGWVGGNSFTSHWKSLERIFTSGGHPRGLQHNNMVAVILFEKAALQIGQGVLMSE